MSDFTVRTASWRNDVSEIKRVRETVFVDEQAVPAELEWDGLDEICIHAIAEDSNRDAIGTGRLHPSGKIGRMAVVADWRGRGVGAEILQTLISIARGEGIEEVYLHGQTRVLEFYARYGFVAEGEEFDEADIPHRMMRRKI
ncbi:MAG: GNAT family N-acetyltransferase [Gammaproteobacteria bacterium]